MTEKTYIKDPNAVLDYTFDWVNDPDGRWLQVGETISSHVITVDIGLIKDSDSESSGLVTVWLSGGTAYTSYTVACKIVTSEGRTDERSITVRVMDR
jgi:hypothetical protein